MPRILVAWLSALFLAALTLAPFALTHAAAATGTPQGGKPVPMDVRDIVEDAIAKDLPLPETAEWHFDFMAPYAGGGDVVCGQVNYQSLQRKYVGLNNFYAIVKSQEVTLAVLQSPAWFDTTGQEAVKFKLLCNRG